MKDKLASLIFSQKNNLNVFSVLVMINFIIMGVGAVTKIAIANTLGKALFGDFAYAIALGSFGMIIARFAQDRTLVRELIHHPEGFNDLVTGSTVLRIIIFSILLISFLVVAAFAQLPLSIILITIASALIALDMQPIFDAQGKIKKHAAYNLLQKSTYFTLIWAAILFYPSIFTLKYIGIIMMLCVVMYLFLQYRLLFSQLIHNIDKSVFLNSLKAGRKSLLIYLAAISGVITTSLNQLFIKHMFGSDALGDYAAPWQLIVVATTLLLQASRIGRPLAAKVTKEGSPREQRIAFIIKYTVAMVLISAPIAFLMIVFPSPILSTLFGPEYLTAVPTMQILGAYLILFPMKMVFEQYVIACRMDRLLLYSQLTGGMLSIITCSVLIPILFGKGAALALLISESAVALICLYGIFKNLKSHTPV